jgi:hypothetical protein
MVDLAGGVYFGQDEAQGVRIRGQKVVLMHFRHMFTLETCLLGPEMRTACMISAVPIQFASFLH